MKLSKVFLQSVGDILSWDIVKRVLTVSIPMGIVWFLIGSLLWDSVVGITSNFISWIPFSVLKANAAFLVGGFAWVVAILTTYAVVIALFNVPIYKLLPAKKYEVFSIVLILVIAILWTLFAVFNWDLVYKELEKVLTWFPFHTLQEGVASLLAVLIFYNLYIVSLYVLVMMFNKPFLRKIASKEYPDIKEVDSIKSSVFLKSILKDMMILFILLILCFPLFFVPFINIFLQIFLWAWFIKESYFLSAANLYATKEEIQKLNTHGVSKWMIAFIAAAINILPIVNIFAPFFAQTLFFHWVMQTKQDRD